MEDFTSSEQAFGHCAHQCVFAGGGDEYINIQRLGGVQVGGNAVTAVGASSSRRGCLFFKLEMGTE